jgi:uncharacterized protein
MIRRSIYLDPLLALLGTPQIKVITGMRRVGKSALMLQLVAELRTRGVAKGQICSIDKEDLAFDAITSYTELAQYVDSYFAKTDKTAKTKTGKKYLLVDEVQDISEWEKAIRHYAKQRDVEVFITGSNSTMLSSELSTYLAGRYVELKVYPLCYREFLQFRPGSDFAEFSRLGGLPGVVTLPNEAARQSALEGILHTVLFKDVIGRYQVRNGALLADVLKFISANIGYPTSTKKIADYLKKERISLAFETVRDYLVHFAQANLIACVGWQDAVGKRSMDLNAKYYFTDIGVRNRLSGMRDEYRGQVLENIVYNELLVRGYSVHIVRVGVMEVDFMAERVTTKGGEKIYIQVTYLLASEDTVQREFKPLLAIPDAYPKMVLSMDTDWGSDYHGVQRLNLVDWLLL